MNSRDLGMHRSLFFLLLASFLLSSCGKMTEPEYLGISNFRIRSLGAGESVITLDLEYHNPNKYGVRMKDTRLDVYVENEYLGEARMDSTIRINPRSPFVVPIQLKAPSGILLRHSIAILMNKKVKLKVEGTTRLGKAGVFVKYPVFYEGESEIINKE